MIPIGIQNDGYIGRKIFNRTVAFVQFQQRPNVFIFSATDFIRIALKFRAAEVINGQVMKFKKMYQIRGRRRFPMTAADRTQPFVF